MPRPRGRQRPPRTWESYAAPIAFLVAATVAILLVRSALRHDSSRPVATTRPPAVTTTATQPATTRKPKPGAKPQYYVVQAGDTFGTIASKSGVTVAQIEQLNPGVASTSLHVGQKIRVG
ncbi:MAG TPA: LysM domain-containing protein [Gaiellaceae bacterium]|nr:LysM domain-containing protein [Gaiellaceae bacterium]